MTQYSYNIMGKSPHGQFLSSRETSYLILTFKLIELSTVMEIFKWIWCNSNAPVRTLSLAYWKIKINLLKGPSKY